MTPPDPEPDDLDLDVDIELRPPATVAERVIVLGAVCRRAYLEGPSAEREHADADRFDLVAWLDEAGLATAITTSEAGWLRARIGTLAPEDVDAASWRAEALVALVWSLRLIESMPAYDRPADPAAALAAVPAPWDKTAAFRAAARLRPEPEIAAERERAELWHWRAETAQLLATATRAERAELRTVIAEVAVEAAAAGLLPPPVAQDLAVDGRPYRDLADDRLATAAAIAAERHRALNWLCGFGADWDQVPTDV